MGRGGKNQSFHWVSRTAWRRNQGKEWGWHHKA